MKLIYFLLFILTWKSTLQVSLLESTFIIVCIESQQANEGKCDCEGQQMKGTNR